MKYVMNNIMNFFILYISFWLPFVSLFLCPSVCPFVCPPACQSNSLPPWHPPMCIQILHSTPSSSTGMWAKFLRFTSAHNQDSVLQRLLLYCKRQISITYLLLLDKDGHVNKRRGAVQELNLQAGTWWCRGTLTSVRGRSSRLHSTFSLCHTIVVSALSH